MLTEKTPRAFDVYAPVGLQGARPPPPAPRPPPPGPRAASHRSQTGSNANQMCPPSAEGQTFKVLVVWLLLLVRCTSKEREHARGTRTTARARGRK